MAIPLASTQPPALPPPPDGSRTTRSSRIRSHSIPAIPCGTFGTPITLAVATGNSGFSGVAFAPTPVVPEPSAFIDNGLRPVHRALPGTSPPRGCRRRKAADVANCPLSAGRPCVASFSLCGRPRWPHANWAMDAPKSDTGLAKSSSLEHTLSSPGTTVKPSEDPIDTRPLSRCGENAKRFQLCWQDFAAKSTGSIQRS